MISLVYLYAAYGGALLILAGFVVHQISQRARLGRRLEELRRRGSGPETRP